jgi:type II secretory pathway component PulF
LAWLPGARAVHRWSQAATFSELLLLLVERGVALDHALQLSAEVTDDARLCAAAKRIAERVQLGGDVRSSDSGKHFQDVSELPLLIRLALNHSANRALLAGSLRQSAVVYRDRAIRAADWYAEYVPILLTVGIGGTLTICYTLLVLWPYASMLRELAR